MLRLIATPLAFVCAVVFILPACGSSTATTPSETPTAGAPGESGAPGAAGAPGDAGAAGAPGAAEDPGTSTSNCAGEAPALGGSTITLQHEGTQRSYRLYVPSSYDHALGTPVVLNFHGTDGSAANQTSLSQLDPVADARNVIVAYPEGLPLDGTQVFNAGLRNFTNEPRDDVDFARRIVDDIATRACVNRRRVYSTGMSNGGRMSYRMACDAADLVAAIAPVAGMLSMPPDQCQPSRPVPNLHFHGTADTVAPYDTVGGLSQMTMPDMFAFWAGKNGCTGEPTVTFDENDVRCEAYTACTNDAEVQLCSVEGGGHCWPGNPVCGLGTSTETIHASEAMLDFLLRFQLP